MGIDYNYDIVENSIAIAEESYPNEIYVRSEYKDEGYDSYNNNSRNSKKRNRGYY